MHAGPDIATTSTHHGIGHGVSLSMRKPEVSHSLCSVGELAALPAHAFMEQ